MINDLTSLYALILGEDAKFEAIILDSHQKWNRGKFLKNKWFFGNKDSKVTKNYFPEATLDPKDGTKVPIW